jgi:hypothetical protein
MDLTPVFHQRKWPHTHTAGMAFEETLFGLWLNCIMEWGLGDLFLCA